MRSLQNTKAVLMNETSGTALTGSVDTQGFRFARVIFSSASTGALTTNTKIEQSDNNSTWEAIPGLVQGTDYTLSTATNVSTKPKIVFAVSMLGKKRYLKATIEHAVSGRCQLNAILSDPADAVGSAADAGTDTIAIG